MDDEQEQEQDQDTLDYGTIGRGSDDDLDAEEAELDALEAGLASGGGEPESAEESEDEPAEPVNPLSGVEAMTEAEFEVFMSSDARFGPDGPDGPEEEPEVQAVPPLFDIVRTPEAEFWRQVYEAEDPDRLFGSSGPDVRRGA